MYFIRLINKCRSLINWLLIDTRPDILNTAGTVIYAADLTTAVDKLDYLIGAEITAYLCVYVT